MEEEKDFDFWFVTINSVLIIVVDIWQIVNFWKYVDELWISIIGTCCFGIGILVMLAFIIISTLNKIEEHKMK